MFWTESRQIKAKDSPQIKDGTMEIGQETLIAEPNLSQVMSKLIQRLFD